MAVQASDIRFRLSTSSGPGCSAAQGNVNNSLGGYVSNTDITDNVLNNLYDNISGDENAAQTVDYRCFFIVNGNGSGTWFSPVAWVSALSSPGANISIGVDPTAASASGATPQQGVTIGTELIAPSGVTFSYPTVKASGIAIGDLTAGQARAIWVKRQATNSTAVDNDSCTLQVQGDTGQ